MQWLNGILIRVYRKWLTKHTPKCPQTPSCGEIAEWAIREYGLRVGLAVALDMQKHCGEREWRSPEDW